MSIKLQRVEAAARVQADADGNDYDALVKSYGVIQVGHWDNGYLAVADEVVTASDALLTNDAAMERVARVLCPMVYGVNWDDAASGMHDTCRSYAYEATAALLGEGE